MQKYGAKEIVQGVRHLPCTQPTWVQSLYLASGVIPEHRGRSEPGPLGVTLKQKCTPNTFKLHMKDHLKSQMKKRRKLKIPTVSDRIVIDCVDYLPGGLPSRTLFQVGTTPGAS